MQSSGEETRSSRRLDPASKSCIEILQKLKIFQAPQRVVSAGFDAGFRCRIFWVILGHSASHYQILHRNPAKILLKSPDWTSVLLDSLAMHWWMLRLKGCVWCQNLNWGSNLRCNPGSPLTLTLSKRAHWLKGGEWVLMLLLLQLSPVHAARRFNTE